MLGDKITNIPRKIFNFFTIEAERLGKESGFKKRCSKLTPAAFVKALLTSCVSEHFTLELFCSVLKEQKIIIRKQSLYERFNDYTVEFLRAMSASCLKYFQLEKLPRLNGLESFTGLNISFKKIIEGHAFFVSRLLPGTKLFTLEKEPLDLLNTLLAGSICFSQQVLMGAQHKIPVRLVAQRLSDECAHRRRQKLKEGHRRRGIKPSQELLALQSWSIDITNTSETQINHQHIHQTYALRWQIEIYQSYYLRKSKSKMKINEPLLLENDKSIAWVDPLKIAA